MLANKLYDRSTLPVHYSKERGYSQAFVPKFCDVRKKSKYNAVKFTPHIRYVFDGGKKRMPKIAMKFRLTKRVDWIYYIKKYLFRIQIAEGMENERMGNKYLHRRG